LAVADGAAFALPVPTPDPDAFMTWSGLFNTLCDSDSTQTGLFRTLVAVVSDSALPQAFVLGKHDHVLMRLNTLQPLPGVQEEDVRWGPDDVEGFWIATLGSGGRSIQDIQPLAYMITEPSGPLDPE
jgi:hypothetical protein